MVDYAVDETFDIFKTQFNDIAEVDGYDEFEDDLLIRLHYSVDEYIGDLRLTETIEDKVILLVTRTAREYGFIDEIEQIDVNEVTGSTDTLSVTIVYSTVRDFQETI
jgi:hypothetical protein